MSNIPISIDIDTTTALNKINQAAGQIESALKTITKPILIDVNTGKATDVIGGLSSEFNKANIAANKMQNEIKSAMAALIVGGKGGTAEFKALESELTKSIAESTKLKTAFDQVESSVSKLNNEGSQTGGIMSKIKESLALGVGVGAGAAGFEALANGIKDVAAKMIGANTEFETYETQLTTLMGSSKLAKDRLAELADFGAKTPFELPEVVRAEKVLQGFGFTTAKTMQLAGTDMAGFRTIVGDIAAGTGSQFEEIATLFGKFGSGATGEALARFQELGIVTKEQLASMGVEFDKAGSLLSPLPKAFEAAVKVAKAKFGGGMDALSQTAQGQASSIADGINMTLKKVGEPIFNAYKQAQSAILGLFNNATFQAAIDIFTKGLTTGFEILDKLSPVLGIVAGAMGAYATYTFAAATATKLKIAWDTAAAASTGLLAVVTGQMTIQQYLLNTAMAINPVGLIIAGFVALAAGIYYAYTKSAAFRDALSMLWTGLKIGWEYLKVLGVTLKEYFIRPFQTAWDVIKALAEGVGNVFGKLKNLDFSGAVAEAKKTASAMSNAVVDNVKEAGKNISDQWTEAGKNSAKMWSEAKKNAETGSKEVNKIVKQNLELNQRINVELKISDNSLKSFTTQLEQLQNGIKTGLDQSKSTELMIDNFIANPKIAADRRTKLIEQIDLLNKDFNALDDTAKKKKQLDFQSTLDNYKNELDLLNNLQGAKKLIQSKTIDANKKQQQQDLFAANQTYKLSREQQVADQNALEKLSIEKIRLTKEITQTTVDNYNQLREIEKNNLIDKQQAAILDKKNDIENLKAKVQSLDVQKQIIQKQKELDNLIITQKLELRAFESKDNLARFNQIVDDENKKNDFILNSTKALVTNLTAIQKMLPNSFQVQSLSIINDAKLKTIKLEGQKTADAFIEGLNIYKQGFDVISYNLTNNLIDENRAKQDIDKLRKTIEDGLLKGTLKGYEGAGLAYKALLDDLAIKIEQGTIEGRNALKKLLGDEQLIYDNISAWELLSKSAISAMEAMGYTLKDVFNNTFDDLNVGFVTVGTNITRLEESIKKSKSLQTDNTQQQLDELKKQYKDDTLTFADYQKKKADLNKQQAIKQQDQDSKTSIYFQRLQLAALKSVQESTTKQTKAVETAYNEYYKILNKTNATESEKLKARTDMRSAEINLVTQQLAGILLTGKATIGDIVGLALDSMAKMLAAETPAIVALIFGKSVAENPIFGTILAGTLTAAFLALAGAAKSALAGAKGAESGYIPGDGYGKRGASDTDLIWVNPNEAIIPQDITARELPLIQAWRRGYSTKDFMMQYLNTDISVKRHIAELSPKQVIREQIAYQKLDDSSLLNEVAKMSKEITQLRKELKKAKIVQQYNNLKVDLNDNRKHTATLQEMYR